MNKVNSILSYVARAVSAGLLFWALAQHSYSYFMILRWFTCVVTAYLAYTAWKQNKGVWVWVFAALALLFNPVLPIHLDRNSWKVIDVATGVFLVISMIFVREDKGASSSPLPRKS